MNEKRNTEMNFRNPEDTNLDWAQLMAIVLSLQNRATNTGAFALAAQLESIRKTLVRSNANKKLIRSIELKIKKIQFELDEKIK